MTEMHSSNPPQSSYAAFKQKFVPPADANGLTLGKALITSTVLAIVIFMVLALATVVIGGAYWLLSN